MTFSFRSRVKPTSSESARSTPAAWASLPTSSARSPAKPETSNRESTETRWWKSDAEQVRYYIVSNVLSIVLVQIKNINVTMEIRYWAGPFYLWSYFNVLSVLVAQRRNITGPSISFKSSFNILLVLLIQMKWCCSGNKICWEKFNTKFRFKIWKMINNYLNLHFA